MGPHRSPPSRPGTLETAPGVAACSPAPTPGSAGHRLSRRLTEAGFVHAFFTRTGGVSAPPFDALSFSVGVGDSEAAVRENRRRAAAVLGIADDRLFYVSQVHGADTQLITDQDHPADLVHKVGDIVVTRTAGVACGVRTADCVPLLIADPLSGSVAAVHSGWKGTLLDVARAGAIALSASAADRARFVAAIGPCISACCFEVGEEVATALAAAPGGSADVLSWGPPSQRARLSGRTEPTRRVDLRTIVRNQLIQAGLSADHIDDVPGCTVCEPRELHSFRRDGARSGRLLSAIVCRG